MARLNIYWMCTTNLLYIFPSVQLTMEEVNANLFAVAFEVTWFNRWCAIELVFKCKRVDAQAVYAVLMLVFLVLLLFVSLKMLGRI